MAAAPLISWLVYQSLPQPSTHSSTRDELLRSGTRTLPNPQLDAEPRYPSRRPAHRSRIICIVQRCRYINCCILEACPN